MEIDEGKAIGMEIDRATEIRLEHRTNMSKDYVLIKNFHLYIILSKL